MPNASHVPCPRMLPRRGRLVKSGRNVAFGRTLVPVEIELDLGAMRIIEEQLPDAAAGKAPQLVFDGLALQCRDRPRQVFGAERHVVEHAGTLLWQRIAMDHVQNRCVAVGSIKPPAGELKGWTPSH